MRRESVGCSIDHGDDYLCACPGHPVSAAWTPWRSGGSNRSWEPAWPLQAVSSGRCHKASGLKRWGDVRPLAVPHWLGPNKSRPCHSVGSVAVAAPRCVTPGLGDHLDVRCLASPRSVAVRCRLGCAMLGEPDDMSPVVAVHVQNPLHIEHLVSLVGGFRSSSGWRFCY